MRNHSWVLSPNLPADLIASPIVFNRDYTVTVWASFREYGRSDLVSQQRGAADEVWPEEADRQPGLIIVALASLDWWQ